MARFPRGDHRQEHRIDIEVIGSDILLGEPETTDSCPIALALKRQFPGNDVDVYEQYVRVGSLLMGGYYDLGIEGRAFVKAFDTAGPEEVFPTKLTLEALEWRFVASEGDKL